jgi:hypothetical protein
MTVMQLVGSIYSANSFGDLISAARTKQRIKCLKYIGYVFSWLAILTCICLLTYCTLLQVYVTSIDIQTEYERYVVEQTRLFDISANSQLVLLCVLTACLAVAYVLL